MKIKLFLACLISVVIFFTTFSCQKNHDNPISAKSNIKPKLDLNDIGVKIKIQKKPGCNTAWGFRCGIIRYSPDDDINTSTYAWYHANLSIDANNNLVIDMLENDNLPASITESDAYTYTNNIEIPIGDLGYSAITVSSGTYTVDFSTNSYGTIRMPIVSSVHL